MPPYSLKSRCTRWYQDPNTDLSTIPSVSLEHCTTVTKAESDHIQVGPLALLCNPLEKNPSQSSQRPTDTIPMRTIHHECQAAIREITTHIQTREQLDELLTQVDDIACVLILIVFCSLACMVDLAISRIQRNSANADRLKGPPVISRKGRPQTQRLSQVL